MPCWFAKPPKFGVCDLEFCACTGEPEIPSCVLFAGITAPGGKFWFEKAEAGVPFCPFRKFCEKAFMSNEFGPPRLLYMDAGLRWFGVP